ncbi:MAG: hypothetical protein HC893_00045 [Chloroflexaceae bacterium]|nr:hypothetical protein [Chloroflexaceae bacterium]
MSRHEDSFDKLARYLWRELGYNNPANLLNPQAQLARRLRVSALIAGVAMGSVLALTLGLWLLVRLWWLLLLLGMGLGVAWWWKKR